MAINIIVPTSDKKRKVNLLTNCLKIPSNTLAIVQTKILK